MKKSLLTDCLSLARRKLYRHPQLEHYPHFAFVIVDNQIASVGVNRQHEPDKRYGYHRRRDKDDFVPKIHAEADAIIKINRITRSRVYGEFLGKEVCINKTNVVGAS